METADGSFNGIVSRRYHQLQHRRRAVRNADAIISRSHSTQKQPQKITQSEQQSDFSVKSNADNIDLTTPAAVYAPEVVSSDTFDKAECLVSGDVCENEDNHANTEPSVSSWADVFLKSLDTLRPEDIPLIPVAKRKRTRAEIISQIASKVAFYAALLVFIYCVYELTATFIEQKRGDDFYSAISNYYSVGAAYDRGSSGASLMLPSVKSEAFIAGVSEPNSGVVKVEEREINEKVEKMRASIASLKNKYPDVYGWIYIDGTNIDYPIVRGKDNEYYLDHAFTGEPMAIGSIFADFRLNDYILNNYNTVLYGHNSSTGKMFAQVMKFAQDEEFFNTAQIYIYTPTGLYIFEPFCLAILDASSYYYRTKFSTPEAFVTFANDMQEKSMYAKRTTFTEDDRILTLSTCTKTGIRTLRYCLQAKLVEIIE